MQKLKKSQSMTLNTVVIAALAILVLVILSFILFKYYGGGSKQLESCVSKGGFCCSQSDVRTGKYIVLPSGECESNEENKFCCKEP